MEGENEDEGLGTGTDDSDEGQPGLAEDPNAEGAGEGAGEEDAGAAGEDEAPALFTAAYDTLIAQGKSEEEAQAEAATVFARLSGIEAEPDKGGGGAEDTSDEDEIWEHEQQVQEIEDESVSLVAQVNAEVDRGKSINTEYFRLTDEETGDIVKLKTEIRETRKALNEATANDNFAEESKLEAKAEKLQESLAQKNLRVKELLRDGEHNGKEYNRLVAKYNEVNTKKQTFAAVNRNVQARPELAPHKALIAKLAMDGKIKFGSAGTKLSEIKAMIAAERVKAGKPASGGNGKPAAGAKSKTGAVMAWSEVRKRLASPVGLGGSAKAGGSGKAAPNKPATRAEKIIAKDPELAAISAEAKAIIAHNTERLKKAGIK